MRIVAQLLRSPATRTSSFRLELVRQISPCPISVYDFIKQARRQRTYMPYLTSSVASPHECARLAFRCTLRSVPLSRHRRERNGILAQSIMSGYYYQDMNGYNGMPQKQQQQPQQYQQQQQQQQQQGGYSQQNSIDDYMVPEEEWEREAVLDPAWERQQKKVIECVRASTSCTACARFA